MRTNNEEYKAYSLLAPVALTATGNGTGIEVAEGNLKDAIATMNIGVVSGTTPTLDMTIQTSDAVGGTYTTVATFGQVTASAKLGQVQVNLEGANSNGELQSYVRYSATIAGTTPSFLTSVHFTCELKLRKLV